MADVYKAVLDLWYRERASDNLCDISRDFEDQVYRYAAQARRDIRISDKRSIASVVQKQEMSMIRRLVESIFDIRLRKIMLLAMQGKQVQNLMDFEKYTYFNLSRIISEHRDRIRNMSYDMKIHSPRVEEKHRFLVHFSEPSSRIMGEDVKAYGPFKRNDIAVLPAGNVRTLVRRQVVDRIYVA